MATPPAKILMVFGATGKTGLHVLEHAVAAKGKNWDQVVVFARNPSKVPEALRDKLTSIQGDLTDAVAIKAAVISCKPTAIVDASSMLPGGKPPNTADRRIMYKAVLEALESDNRTSKCYLVMEGGVVVPEPGGTINSCLFSLIHCCVRNVFARTMFRDLEKFLVYMWEETPPDFRFTMVRMGPMVEKPSMGVLQAEPTKDNIPKGSVTYSDAGFALQELAADLTGTTPWNRKALFYNYPSAK